MGIHHIVFLLLQFLYAFANAEQLSGATHFQSLPEDVWFREGMHVQLFCRQQTTDNIEIRYSGTPIVRKSVLIDGASSRYEFRRINDTMCVLIIQVLHRTDRGIYTCKEGETRSFASLEVMYAPSDNEPTCYSNYDSPVIFDDERQDHIQFSCETEKANPPVLVTVFIFSNKSTKDSTEIERLCNPQNDENRVFLSCDLNEAFNSMMFGCNVTQISPIPGIDGYHGSCSFGPLRLVPGFAVSVSPLYVAVNKGANVTFTCSSNVSDVEKQWINIPHGLEYTVMNHESSTFLSIYSIQQHPNSPFTITCNGSYGNRHVLQGVTIEVNVGLQEQLELSWHSENHFCSDGCTIDLLKIYVNKLEVGDIQHKTDTVNDIVFRDWIHVWIFVNLISNCFYAQRKRKIASQF